MKIGSAKGNVTPRKLAPAPGWTIWTGEVPGGESADTVRARADRMLASVEPLLAERDIVLVGHGQGATAVAMAGPRAPLSVRGAVLGGVLGNVISKDIDCNDQPYAFQVYSNGLNGQVGRRYDWNRGQNRGYFTPVREYRRRGVVCRDFTTTTYRRGREITRTGTACRDARDGNWRFD